MSLQVFYARLLADSGFASVDSVDGMSDINSKLDLEHLSSIIAFLIDDINSYEPRRVVSAYSEYHDLLDKFASKFAGFLNPEQIEMARSNPDHFQKLIDIVKSNVFLIFNCVVISGNILRDAI